jgi:hypothetical protein
MHVIRDGWKRKRSFVIDLKRPSTGSPRTSTPLYGIHVQNVQRSIWPTKTSRPDCRRDFSQEWVRRDSSLGAQPACTTFPCSHIQIFFRVNRNWDTYYCTPSTYFNSISLATSSSSSSHDVNIRKTMGQCQSSARSEKDEGPTPEEPDDPLKPIEVLYCVTSSPSLCSSMSTMHPDDESFHKKSDSITASMSLDDESVSPFCDRHINWIQVQTNQNTEVQLVELVDRVRL